MGAGSVGGLLGAGGEPLDGRDGVRREPGVRGVPGGCGGSSGAPQLGKLLAQLGHKSARLVGALLLVPDRALERLKLGVRVRKAAR